MDIKEYKKIIYDLLTSITDNVYNNIVPVNFTYDKSFCTYTIESNSAIYTIKELAGNDFSITINYHSKNQSDIDDFFNSLLNQFKNEDYIIRFNNSTQIYNEDIEMHQLTVIYRSLV